MRGLSARYFSFLPSLSFHQCTSYSFVYLSLMQCSLSNRENHEIVLEMIITLQNIPEDCNLYMQVQCVPLVAEPGISLIILTPMKILQRNLNRSTFVV